MKVKHLEFHANRILVPGTNAKTHERYTGMNQRLRRILVEAGIKECDADHFIFSPTGKPGTQPCGKNYFYKRFVKYMEHMGLKGNDYTLYSFNHSGAIQLYLATKDPYLVQQQKGHTTLSQTQKYLRDLGLFVDFTDLDKWSGF